MFLSHIDVSFSFSLSVKPINISSGEDLKKKKRKEGRNEGRKVSTIHQFNFQDPYSKSAT